DLARLLFDERLPHKMICAETPEQYFALLSVARAVFAGRLHTAVVSFSLGVPFVLLDVDQRTSGVIKTYGLQNWSAAPSLLGFSSRLTETIGRLFADNFAEEWEELVARRNAMHHQALDLLRHALKSMS